MRHGRLIYVLGDVHGNFGVLNTFINIEIRQNKGLMSLAPHWRDEGYDLQVIVIQCGDFGYFWPFCDAAGCIRNKIDFLPHGHVPLYWIGGNHEDWDKLDSLGPGITEIEPGIFYCPFGSTLAIAPQVTVLFAGGSESADKEWRLDEMKKGAPKIWWEQEGISAQDMKRLDLVPKADWVVSHTAPAAFDLSSQLRLWNGIGHLSDPSRSQLDRILAKYKPSRWFFGHFHQYMSGCTAGCEWECLASMDSGSKCWERISFQWND